LKLSLARGELHVAYCKLLLLLVLSPINSKELEHTILFYTSSTNLLTSGCDLCRKHLAPNCFVLTLKQEPISKIAEEYSADEQSIKSTVFRA
jgi:hypothetical protein